MDYFRLEQSGSGVFRVPRVLESSSRGAIL